MELPIVCRPVTQQSIKDNSRLIIDQVFLIFNLNCLCMVLPQLKLLISLAQIDGSVAEKEQNYIINIGRANGIYPDEVMPLLEQRHLLVVPADLSNETKFNYIFSLVQLMKIDERMYKEEVLFCSKIAICEMR